MEIKTSVNKQGQIYIPSKVREAIGIPLDEEKKVILIGDMRALFIIPSEFSPKEALESLKVISEHLRHKANIEENNKNEG